MSAFELMLANLFKNHGEKPGKTQLGFFQSGFNNPATVVELHQYIWLLREPGRQLQENYKRK
jgi:hypothetical protein